MQEKIPEQWQCEIKPKTSLFALNLKKVWDYRDLLFNFVQRKDSLMTILASNLMLFLKIR